MKLSENFTLAEMTVSETGVRHGIDNTPDNTSLMNLRRLALLLEDVRKIVNKPIHINSAYRNVQINKLINSKSSSQHCKGAAADIRVTGMTPDQVVRAIVQSNLDYDQVIREFDSWTHISITNKKEAKARKQALIIDRKGTRPFL